MKILVTGANGYLGHGVVKTLCDMGVHVVATDFGTEHIDERAEAVAVNLFDLEDPYGYFGEPDVVLHMAWRNGFVHNAPSHIQDLPSHFTFLSKMAASGVKQMAVMGSMHEIGFWEGCIREDTPCNPMNYYGISKDALRKSCKLLCSEHKTLFQWLRGYYIVGNNEQGSSIFSKIVQAANQGKETFPFTTGQNQYDFVDYEDFCRQVAAVVTQDRIDGIINICSGRPEKLADRVERFIKENGLNIRLEYGVFPDRAYDSNAVWGSDEKIAAIMTKTE